MGLFKKKTEENAVKSYQTMYLGGHPENPKKVAGIVDVQLLDNCFLFKHRVAEKYLKTFEIPYSSVTDFAVVDRTLTTGNILFGGKDAYKLQQANNVHITYDDQNGNSLTVRFEMISGVTVTGQAKVCLEMVDYLKANGIYAQFNLSSANQPAPAATNDNVLEQIEKLAQLKNDGILSEEEFQAKKAQLLEKL